MISQKSIEVNNTIMILSKINRRGRRRNAKPLDAHPPETEINFD